MTLSCPQRWFGFTALFLLGVGLGACARHGAISTSELHCPDPPVGGVVDKQSLESALGDSVGLMMRIHVAGGDGVLEPSVLRVVHRGTQVPLATPLPQQPGLYWYPGLTPGWYVIEVRRIGYNAVTDSVEIKPGHKELISVGMRYKVTCLI